MPKATKVIRYPNGQPAPILYGSASRVNDTATGTSTAAAALPTGSKLIEVRATADIWIRFGTSGVGAAAADANSILFLGGEKIMPVPYSAGTTPSTHFRVLRVGANDVAVQIERIDTEGN